MRNHENRIGKFKVTGSFIRGYWPDLLPMFGNFVPVEIRYDWMTQTVEYTAYSPLFDICDGFDPPIYDISFDSNKIPAEIRAQRLDRNGLPVKP